MRRLIEEYGIVLLYIITGLLCILLFSAAFFGDNSAVSKVIESSIDSSANRDTKQEYTATLYLNGGNTNSEFDGWTCSGSGDNVVCSRTFTIDDAFNLPIPTKVHDADKPLFAGWFKSNDAKPSEKVGSINHGSTGNRVFYAAWTNGHYQIVFNSRLKGYSDAYADKLDDKLSFYLNKNVSGVGEELISSWMEGDEFRRTFEFGLPVSMPNDGIVFKGHKLIGWTTVRSVDEDAPLTFDYAAGSTVENNRIEGNDTPLKVKIDSDRAVVKTYYLYAVWEPITYEVNYHHSNQGILGVSDKENPDTYNILDGVVLKKAVLNGYTLSGWYTRDPYMYETDDQREAVRFTYKATDAKTGEALLPDTFIDYIGPGTTGNLDLYSYFTKNNYDVVLHLVNNEESGTLTLHKEFSTNLFITAKDGDVDKTPHMDGYDFLGWEVGDAKRINGLLTDSLIKNNSYVNDDDLRYNETKYSEAVAVPNGRYVVNLYPVFGPHQYLIQFSANGGVNAPAAQVKFFGKPLDFLASDVDTNGDGEPDKLTNQMTRVGYEFMGWALGTSADVCNNVPGNQCSGGENQKIFNGVTYYNFISKDNEYDEFKPFEQDLTTDAQSVTLIAVWESEPVQLTLDLNMENITEMRPDEAYVNELDILRKEVRNFGADYPETTYTFEARFGHKYSEYLDKPLFMSENQSDAFTDNYKYKFDGWYFEKECIHKVNIETYGTDGFVDDISLGSESRSPYTYILDNRPHTLYAKWTPITYKIVLHSNFN